MPYTLKDTARLIGGTKVGKRVEKNTIDDIGTGNRNSNDVIDMDYISPGLQGMAPQNEQEIEIEDELLKNTSAAAVPLDMSKIGKALGKAQRIDGGRTWAVTIGDQYSEVYTKDSYEPFGPEQQFDRKTVKAGKKDMFYVRGDDAGNLGLPSLSGDKMVDLMLYLAAEERGEGEAGGTDNDTKYGEWYYNRRVKDNPATKEEYPWCATFVSWVANKAGMGSSDYNTIDGVVPKYEGCGTGQDLYRSKGRLHEVGDKNDDYKPKAGDTFFMTRPGYPNGTGHTGFVFAYDEKSDSIYTIEGNSENCVQFLRRPRSSIYSFGSNGGTKYGIIPKSIDASTGRTQ